MSNIIDTDRPKLAELGEENRFYFVAEIDKFSPKSRNFCLQNIKKIENLKPRNWVNLFKKNKKFKDIKTDHLWTDISTRLFCKISKNAYPSDDYDYMNDLGNWVVLFSGFVKPYYKGYYGDELSHNITNIKTVAFYSKKDRKLFNNLS